MNPIINDVVPKQTYTIVNDADPNDMFFVEADNSDEAAHLALAEIGWWVAAD